MNLTEEIDNTIKEHKEGVYYSRLNEIWLDPEAYKEFGRTEYKGYSVHTMRIIKKGYIMIARALTTNERISQK